MGTGGTRGTRGNVKRKLNLNHYNMKPIVFFGIAFRIVLITLICMAMTYFPDMLRDFFDDVKCTHYHGYRNIENKVIGVGDIDQEWHWGTRHYYYHIATIALFILTLSNFVIEVILLIDKHYPSKKGS